MAKILLVEDDNNLREIYEARLQAEGYEIVSARDGEEALTVAMKERPDLIISDVMMPKISGFDMLDIIRSTEETKHAKVIMMTALSQAEDKERAEKLGADRYLVKSQVTLEDVAKVAKEVLNSDGPPATPAATTSTDASEGSQPVTPATVTPTTSEDDASSQGGDTTNTASNDEGTSQQTTQSDDNSTIVTPTPITTDTVAPDNSQPQVAVATDSSSDNIATQSDSTDQDPPSSGASVAPEETSPVQSAQSSTPESEQTPDNVNPQTGTKSEDSANLEANAEASSQSIDKEQSAVAAQIESALKSGKDITGQNPQAEESESISASQVDNPPQTTAVPPVKKKVIEPINDLTKPQGPELEKLLVKEEEKEEMAEIAKKLATNTEVVNKADEAVAAAELRAAAREASASSNPQQTPTTSTPTELKITESGEMVVPASTADTATQTQANPDNAQAPTTVPDTMQAQTTTPPSTTQTEASVNTEAPEIPAPQQAPAFPEPQIAQTSPISIPVTEPTATATTPVTPQPQAQAETTQQVNSTLQDNSSEKTFVDPNSISL